MDTYRHEIIVAGGGFTGVAAAVAAAREGRDVLLVEKSGFLGGAATNCLVNPFMNYFCKDMETGESTPINRGFFEEILNELKAMGGLHENKRTFNEEYLKSFWTGSAPNTMSRCCCIQSSPMLLKRATGLHILRLTARDKS